MDIYQLYSYIGELESPDPRIRYRVISQLASVKDIRCVAPLLAVLDDSDRWCRISAVRALGEIGHSSAKTPLESCLASEDHLIVSTAIIALKSVGDEQSLEAVAGFLLDTRPRICADAVEGVGALSSRLKNRTYLPAMKPLLQNPNNRVVANAVVALCCNEEMASGEMVQFIREKFLSSGQKWTRASGVFALGAIGCGESELIQALEDKSVDVVMNAIKSLGRIPQSASVHTLVNLLARENIRHKVVQALGDQGNRTATQPLLKYFPTSNIAVQRKIIQSLGKIGDPAALDLLVAKLTDDHVAREAVAALGAIRHPRSSQALLELLQKPLSHEIELSVIQALGNTKDSSIIPTLMGLFQTSQPPRIFESVSWALAKLGKTAIPSLFLLLETPQATQYALRAFAELGSEAVPFLIDHLKHPKTAINAMMALVQIGDTGIPFLRQAFADHTNDVAFQLLVCQSMYRILSPHSLGFFVANLGSPIAEIRRFSAFVLPMFGNYDLYKKEIQRFLANEDHLVRVACIRVLSLYRQEPEIQSELAKHLEDPYWAVRYYALEAVSDIETPELLGKFKALVESSDQIVSRKAVQHYLKVCGVQVSDLVESTNFDPDLLKGIFPILTNISRPEEVEELIPFLGHPLESVSGFFQRVLLHLIDSSRSVLIARLRVAESPIRDRITRILGLSGCCEALPVIADLVRSENQSDQRQALVESMVLFGPRAVPSLFELFEGHEFKDDVRLQELILTSLEKLNQGG
jgi:HEAT repeat protein